MSDDDKQSWQAAIANLKQDLDTRLDDLRSRGNEQMESASRVIQDHPLLAVGTAIAVGVLVGALLGRQSRD